MTTPKGHYKISRTLACHVILYPCKLRDFFVKVRLFSVYSADTCWQIVGLYEQWWAALTAVSFFDSFNLGNIRKKILWSQQNFMLVAVGGQNGGWLANDSRWPYDLTELCIWKLMQGVTKCIVNKNFFMLTSGFTLICIKTGRTKVIKQNQEVYGRMLGVWQRIEAVRFKMKMILFSYKNQHN